VGWELYLRKFAAPGIGKGVGVAVDGVVLEVRMYSVGAGEIIYLDLECFRKTARLSYPT
jgi:hypothetical protein